jgi:hypothetical protein
MAEVGTRRPAARLDEVDRGTLHDVPVRLEDVREDGLVVLASARHAGPGADGFAQRGDPPRVSELVDLVLDELGGFVVLSLHGGLFPCFELANLGADSLESVDAVAQFLGGVVVLPGDCFVFERVNLANLYCGDGIDVEVDGHVSHARAPRGPRSRREVTARAGPPGVGRGDGLADDVDGDDAHLVVDVELVDVTLVDDDAEDGGVDVDVHGLELPRLVPARGVRVEAQVTEAAHDGAVHRRLARREQARVQLNLRGDLVLVRQQLDLVDARGVVQTQDELLGELREPRALPSSGLRGVEVELTRGIVRVLRSSGAWVSAWLKRLTFFSVALRGRRDEGARGFGAGINARISHLACGVSHGEAELGARRWTIHARCGSL